MAPWSVVTSPLAILPPTPSQFCPLAPYCPISWHPTATPLPGWHPSAHHRLAPYCSPPAGTLLLTTGWHPTAHHRLAPYCYSPAGTLLLFLRSVDPSSVTPSRGIALPPWLLSYALGRCNNLPDRTSRFRWALHWTFPMSPINNPLPAGRVSGG